MVGHMILRCQEIAISRGELTTPVKANYLRVLYTADYDARFVGFTELVINDGEFVKPINDPTVEGNGSESRGNFYTNLVDGKVFD